MKYWTAILLLLSIWLLTTGEMGWLPTWQGAVERLFGNSGSWNPLLDERIPRLIVLIASGASLAVAGAIMQALFQNPLAAPNLLGISAGGSLAAFLLMATGWHLTAVWLLPLTAVVGSFLALGVIFLLSRASSPHPTQFILVGIAFSTLLITCQQVLEYVWRDYWHLILMAQEWQAGTTWDRSWEHVHLQLPLTLAGLAIAFSYRSELNLFSLGEEEALHLGVDVPTVRRHLFCSVALLTGGTLASLGTVAFFGFILPHIIRLVIGCDWRRALPYCALLGSCLLIFFDATLRTLHLTSFTVGHLSALIGSFLFLAIAFRGPLYAFQHS